MVTDGKRTLYWMALGSDLSRQFLRYPTLSQPYTIHDEDPHPTYPLIPTEHCSYRWGEGTASAITYGSLVWWRPFLAWRPSFQGATHVPLPTSRCPEAENGPHQAKDDRGNYFHLMCSILFISGDNTVCGGRCPWEERGAE